MLQRNQPSQANGGQARTYYLSQSLFPWLYVQNRGKWHVYASDGTWIQDQRAISKETRAHLKEISEAEAEALLSAGRAKTVDVESPPRVHFLPPWKAPMAYIRWMVLVVVAGGFIALNAVVGSPNWSLDSEATPFWPALAHVLVVPALWVGLFLWARRGRERQPPSGPNRRSWWQRGSGGPG